MSGREGEFMLQLSDLTVDRVLDRNVLVEDPPELEALAGLFRALAAPNGQETPSPALLAAMVVGAQASTPPRRVPAGGATISTSRHRASMVAAVAAGVALGMSGLAAADVLPDPIQHIASVVLDSVGVNVPDPDRPATARRQSPGGRPDTPPGRNGEQPGNRPDVPPGQDDTVDHGGRPETPPGLEGEQPENRPDTPPGQVDDGTSGVTGAGTPTANATTSGGTATGGNTGGGSGSGSKATATATVGTAREKKELTRAALERAGHRAPVPRRPPVRTASNPATGPRLRPVRAISRTIRSSMRNWE